MPSFALVGLLLAAAPDRVPAPPLTDAEAARRDALARFGVGVIRAQNNLPVQATRQFEAAAKAAADSPGPLRPLVALYADLGRHAAAVRTGRRVLELDPDDAETAQRLGQLLYDGKKYADAAAVLRKAAASPRLADHPARRLGVLRDLARADEKANDLAAAADALRAASVLLGEHRDALVRFGRFSAPAEGHREAAAILDDLGHVLTMQKKFAEATSAYQEAHRTFADPAKANDPAAAARLHWNLSGVLSEQGKADEALAHLNQFLALRPSGTAPYERFADLLRRVGRADRVPAELARLADQNPKNEAVRWVVAAEVAKSDPATGRRQFGALMETTTDERFYRLMVGSLAGSPSVLLNVADTLSDAAGPPEDDADPPPGFEAAVERARAFTAAVKAQPNLTAALLEQATADARAGRTHAEETWALLAGLAERDGQLPAAEEMLRHAAAAAGGRRAGPRGRPRGDPAAALLDVLAKQRKWREAREQAQLLTAGRGNREPSGAAYIALAMACAELGEAGEAMAALDRLEERFKFTSPVAPKMRRVTVLNILGRHKGAVDECLKLLEQFPNPGDQRQVRIGLSAAYLGLGKHAEAESELRAILDGDPDDVLALNNLGFNLADQGRNLAEAEAMVRRALEIDAEERLRNGAAEPESGTYLDSLGWVLFRRGKLAEARDILERAVRMPDSATSGEVWDHLGDVRFRLGGRPAARAAWEKASELYADTHEGRQGGRRDEVQRKLKQVR